MNERVMLVPLDGSELAEGALPVASRIAAATGAALQLVRAQPFILTAVAPYPYVPDIGDVQAEIEAAAEAYLRQQRSQLPAEQQVETVLLRGPAAGALLDFFTQQTPDLVVMTTHGRGGVKWLVLGSTADRIVRAGLPALLLKPETRPGELLPAEAAGTANAGA